MFRTLAKAFLPNPFDAMLKRTSRKGGKKILLGWNRGLGDIALGLYAMVERIRFWIPDAEITFATRENLLDGFSMLEGVDAIGIEGWKRGEAVKIPEELKRRFDLVIERPSPTDWVYWQRGKVVPKLKWDEKHEQLYEKFSLSKTTPYVGVQVSAETHYGLWRNWPLERWEELFDQLDKKGIQVLLFGYGTEPRFKTGIDLRGKTTLFELLSIIKNRCSGLVVPDSGVASMSYYLNASFPLTLVTLWADPNHGILKQNVPSPNPQLIHRPLIGTNRDLSTVSAESVVKALFPPSQVGAVLLAGGQGSRLGFQGPKGLFPVGGKSLFAWACQKIPKEVPLAVMTSPLNHDETVAYFEKENYFGLEVYFFQQEMEPLLDGEKKITPLNGPNGNGSVFRSFANRGLRQIFEKKGIEWLIVSNIENPLTDPADLSLVALGQKEEADAVVQCIERAPSDRSMGVLVEKGEKIEIVEYTELDPKKEYRYAYTGQIAFAFPFFSRMADIDLPIHWVQKQSYWKGEKFIFDALPFASRVRALEVDREKRFAPLKGGDCIEAVERVLRG